MRQFYIMALLFVFVTSCSSDQVKRFVHNPKEVVSDKGVTVEVFDFENFKHFFEQKNDQIHVINFWATWCVPCVAELPYFEQLGQENPEIEVVLVSLDFPKKVKENLIPFILENNLQSEVILLDEPDANKWIPQIDSSWSGAIPATFIIRKTKASFTNNRLTL